jgi:hypothetical protein
MILQCLHAWCENCTTTPEYVCELTLKLLVLCTPAMVYMIVLVHVLFPSLVLDVGACYFFSLFRSVSKLFIIATLLYFFHSYTVYALSQ